jgi:hypothetical protein
MKKSVILSLLFCFSYTFLTAQVVHTDYFLRNSQSRSSLNPAFLPKQGYFGIPFLTDFGAGVHTNALYLDNLVFDRNGEKVTFLHPTVGSSEFLSNIPDKSFVAADVNYKLFSLGFFDAQQGFWTIDIGARALLDVTVPKPLFELLKVGFSADPSQATQYTINDLKASTSEYAEVGLGYGRSILDGRLSLGAKVKLLFGIANLDLSIDRLELASHNNEWTARSQASLGGSLKGIKPVYDEDGLFESIETDGIGLAGFGLGLDAGAVYSLLNNKARISLAVTDLGFISWSGGNSINLLAPETQVSVTPGDYTFGSDDSSLSDNFETSIDDLTEAINFKESGKAQGRSTKLRTQVNAGLEYEVWAGNLSAGLLSSTYFAYNTVTELTLSANYNPERVRWFSAALSYSFMFNKFNTIGLALHLSPGKGLNFFVASDYWIPNVSSDALPIRTKAANLQFGISVPMGRIID